MKSPLRKRYLRELKQEMGKYLVILMLMVTTIGFVSGFLVADGSMLAAYRDGFERYTIEDGHFRTTEALSSYQRRQIEGSDAVLSEQFYRTLQLTNDSHIRVFADRKTVNTVCLMKGRMPDSVDEVALDRMYADNNDLKVGDQIATKRQTLTVTGLVALPDYSCLFEHNSDSMFDAVKFGVGIMTEEGFSHLPEKLMYSYVWRYHERPASVKEEKDEAEELMKRTAKLISLKEFVPQYLNQAIQFTGEDMGSDKAMITVLLYLVMVILAFVFALTTADTITKESAVIGTLRASGFTKSELIRHYLMMPFLVTLLGALLGNILGYTKMKDVCAGMYYGSYSLPTYVTIWNGEAFVMTTVVPVAIMAAITFFVLYRRLQLSPLEFLRRTDHRRAGRRAMRLHHSVPLFTRFQMRVVMQNAGNYCIMLAGIVFANLLLMFGLILHPILVHYQAIIEDNMLSRYQYFLSVPQLSEESTDLVSELMTLMEYQLGIQTENPDAEKFSAWSLQALGGAYRDETITFYGLEANSRYVPLTLTDEDVFVSSSYAEKFGLAIGDEIHLKEKYEDTEYTFPVTGIYDYPAGMAVFMTRSHLNAVFDLDGDYFGGYFSDSPITDISGKYIETVIDLEALTKVSRQLESSMGNMMYLVQGFSILIFVVVIYLLSKVIIEKNAGSISMVKILGYSDREVRRLYVHATTVVVLCCIVISIPVSAVMIAVIWRAMMASMMSGWLPFILPKRVIAEMIIIGSISYLLVAVVEFRKIRRIPMTLALKNVE